MEPRARPRAHGRARLAPAVLAVTLGAAPGCGERADAPERRREEVLALQANDPERMARLAERSGELPAALATEPTSRPAGAGRRPATRPSLWAAVEITDVTGQQNVAPPRLRAGILFAAEGASVRLECDEGYATVLVLRGGERVTVDDGRRSLAASRLMLDAATTSPDPQVENIGDLHKAATDLVFARAGLQRLPAALVDEAARRRGAGLQLGAVVDVAAEVLAQDRAMTAFTANHAVTGPCRLRLSLTPEARVALAALAGEPEVAAQPSAR